MVLFTSLMLLLMIFAFKERITTQISIQLLISFTILCIYLSEYSMRGQPFFISDEIIYYNLSFSDLIHNKDRMLWFVINIFERDYDLFGTFFLKVINIPILYLLVISLYILFDRNRMLLFLPLYLPYLNIISIRDFRDVLLYTIWILLFLTLKFKKYFYFLFCIIALYFLRPFLAMISVISGIIVILRTSYLNCLARRSYQSLIGLLLMVTFLFGCLSYGVVKVAPRIVNYQKYFSYVLTPKMVKERVNERGGGVMTGNLLKDIPLSMVRYCTTPLPSSYVNKLLSDDSSEYGYNDDIMKIIHQTIYLFMLLYVILQGRNIPLIWRQFDIYQKVLLINFLIFMFIYSIYYFGMGHLRLKIPFQLLIVILFIYIYKFKGNLFSLRHFKLKILKRSS